MFKLDKLIEVLEDLRPVELKGVALLRERRLQTGDWFPGEALSADDAITATFQLVEYGDRCLKVIQRLEADADDPVPLSAPLVEYPL